MSKSILAGGALVAAGLLTFGLNAFLTPLLPDGSFAEIAASDVFFLRQSLSALAALLLIAGAVGVQNALLSPPRAFDTVAVVAALWGSALVLCVEWGEVFIIRGLALAAPEALSALESATEPTLYDIGAMSALALFAVGWIAVGAAALLRGGARLGSLLVILGFFAIPILGVSAPKPWGFIAGNGVLAMGWILIGLAVMKGRAAA